MPTATTPVKSEPVEQKSLDDAFDVEEPVEIVFDFSQVPLFEFLDLMELSAVKETGQDMKAGDVIGFVHCLKKAYVSSSRPLVVSDFEATVNAFWRQAEIFKNPNA
jgi:hypothetical protein